MAVHFCSGGAVAPICCSLLRSRCGGSDWLIAAGCEIPLMRGMRTHWATTANRKTYKHKASLALSPAACTYPLCDTLIDPSRAAATAALNPAVKNRWIVSGCGGGDGFCNGAVLFRAGGTYCGGCGGCAAGAVGCVISWCRWCGES